MEGNDLNQSHQIQEKVVNKDQKITRALMRRNKWIVCHPWIISIPGRHWI
jgi:hypothetical protein